MNSLFHRPKFKFALAWIFIALVYTTIRIPYLDVPLNRDEGIYAHGGRMILQGKLPCKDIPDYNPPFVFLLNAVMLLLLSPKTTSIHMFFYAYNFAAMVCLYFFSAGYFRSRGAGLWSALSFAVFTASPSVFGFAATAEHAALLPIAASLLTARLGVTEKNWKYFFLSGNLAASACWIKQQFGFSAFAILFFVLYELYRLWTRRELTGRDWLAGAAAWIGGTFFITGVLAFYYYLHDGLADLIYWTFVQGFHYSSNVSGLEIFDVLFDVGLTAMKSNAFIFAAAMGAGIWAWSQRDHRALVSFAILLLSAAGVFFGRAYPHYLLMFAPGLAMSSGVFLDRALSGKKILVAAGISAVLAGVYFEHWDNFALRPWEISDRYFPGNPFPITPIIARQIAANTKRSDTILVVGSEPQIFLRSNRASATSFLSITPLTERFPRHKEFQEKYWADILKNDPAYIVFVNLAMSICWDGMADFEIFNRIMDLINRDYDLQWSYTVQHGLSFMELKPFTRHIYVFRKKSR